MNRIVKAIVTAAVVVPALAACGSTGTTVATAPAGNGEPTLNANAYILAMQSNPSAKSTICKAFAADSYTTAQMALQTAPADLGLTLRDAQYALAYVCA